MLIIPTIHILDGKCVRLFKGDFEHQKVYAHDPLEQAIEFEKQGADMLHIVDLDGVRAGKVVNAEIIRQICEQTDIAVEFGGGIRSEEEIEALLALGLDRIVIATMAAEDGEYLDCCLKKFGADKIGISVDTKNGMVVTRGWTKSTEINGIDFAEQMVQKGFNWIIFTDVYRDGTLTLPNFDDIDKLVQLLPEAKVIASGGVSKTDHLKTLHDIGVEGVILGRALYEEKIQMEEIAGKY